jgi:hypothetical protein
MVRGEQPFISKGILPAFVHPGWLKVWINCIEQGEIEKSTLLDRGRCDHRERREAHRAWIYPLPL